MIIRSLDVMLSKPGIWLINGAELQFFVEVLPGGECHQLDPRTFNRDGVLPRENWVIHGSGADIVGPLARP